MIKDSLFTESTETSEAGRRSPAAEVPSRPAAAAERSVNATIQRAISKTAPTSQRPVPLLDELVRPLGVHGLACGLHEGVPEAAYHADLLADAPTLSSTLARVLLNESPRHAALRHPRLNPEGLAEEGPRSPALVRGSLVHALLAEPEGSGAVEIGEYENYKSKAAREWREAVTASGKMAVLESEFDEAEPIAEAVRRSFDAAHLSPFDTSSWRSAGVSVTLAASELTAIWREGESSTYARARFDRLIAYEEGGSDFAYLYDWKTCRDISDRGIERAIAERGYAFQLAFYERGLRALNPFKNGKLRSIRSRLVFVESTAPHTVRHVELSPEYLRWAQGEVQRAFDLWAQCRARGRFEDPRNGTRMTVELPAWLLGEGDGFTLGGDDSAAPATAAA